MDLKFDRPTDDEMALVFDAWVSSFRKSPWAGCVRNDMWTTVQRATIAGILARGAEITVVLAPTVPGVFTGRRVMGYAVAEPRLETLHWIYVKDDYRRKGVGRALLNHVAGTWHLPRYTHRTRQSQVLLPKKWRWDAVPARVRDVAPDPK